MKLVFLYYRNKKESFVAKKICSYNYLQMCTLIAIECNIEKIYILEFIIKIFTNDQRRKDIILFIKYIYIKQMLHLTSVIWYWKKCS